MEYQDPSLRLEPIQIHSELCAGMRAQLIRVWASGGEMMQITEIMHVWEQTLSESWDPSIQRFNIPMEMMLANMALRNGGQLRPDTRQAIVDFLTTHPHINIKSVAYLSRPVEESPPVIVQCCDCQRGRMMVACQREPRSVAEASQILLQGIRAVLVDLQYEGHHLDARTIEGIVRGCDRAFSRRSWYPHERQGKGGFRVRWSDIADGIRFHAERLPHGDQYAPGRAISTFLNNHPWVISCR